MIVPVIVAGSITAWFIYSLLKSSNSKSKESLRTSGTRRHLEGLESFLHNLEKAGTGSIGNILCLTSQTPLTSALISETLTCLAHRHPLLRAKLRVVDDGNGSRKKYFEITESNDNILRLTNVPLSADKWQQAWQERHYTHTFEENDFLWTTTILRQEFDIDSKTYRNTLLFFFHHSIADGVSTAEFTKQFVETLNESANNAGEQSTKNSQEFTAMTDSLPLMPGAFSLLHHKVGFSALQKALRLPQLLGVFFQLAMRLETKWRKPNPLLEGFIQSCEKEQASKDLQPFVFQELTASETRALVNVARNHDTTVNCILLAVGHTTLCEMLQADFPSLSSPQSLDMVLAVSTRKDCSPKPPGGCIGNYAVPCILSLPFIERGSDDILKLAKNYKEKIKKQTNGNHLMVHRVFESIGGDKFSQLSSDLSRQRRRVIPEAITNVGRLEVPNGPFEVSRLLFLVSMRPTPGKDTTMFCNMVVTFNGKLYWITGYDYTLVGKKEAENYVARIFEKIQSLINY